MKVDPFIKGGSTTSTKMVVTKASAIDMECFVMSTEVWGRYRVITIGADGMKAEFTSNESGLRTLRHALNRMAEEEKWDVEDTK